MQYRTLGKTNLKVSEVGMGCWQLAGRPWGWSLPDEQESLKALNKFVDLGGNFIDTAWVYGNEGDKNGGHSSEELVGQFVKESGKRDQLVIATKVPPKNTNWPAWKGIPISEVFPNDHIIQYVDDSLKNLGIDSIDLMQFHVWQDDFANDDGWKNTIQKITQAGKVKHWGISINDYQPSNCLKTLDTGLISAIQFIFNIFHQKPTEKLLPFAKKHNIGLIARVPFDEGGLTNRHHEPGFASGELKSHYFNPDRIAQLDEHVQRLLPLLDSEASSLPDLALRYVLSFDEVSSVIPGMRKVQHVEANVSASDGRKLSEQLMSELKNHVWERNFYPDLDPLLKVSDYVEP